MKKTDLAYIAGFFDGEGSVFISKRGKQYSLSIDIANANLGILKDIQRNLKKGKISKTSNGRCFRLKIYCREAKAFLEKLLPYLRVKKEQAELAILFQSKMEMGRRTLTIQEQEDSRVKINSFNKKRKRRPNNQKMKCQSLWSKLQQNHESIQKTFNDLWWKENIKK